MQSANDEDDEGNEGHKSEAAEEVKAEAEKSEAAHEQAREDNELYHKVHDEWEQNILNEHLIFINGVEMIYHEFKELLLEVAIRLKDQIDSEPGKLKSLLKKFMTTLFLRRLGPYIKFSQTKQLTAVQANLPTRKWPESQKDKDIKVILVEKAKRQEEQKRIQMEEAAKNAELEAQAEKERLELEAQREAELKQNEEVENANKQSKNPDSAEDEDEEESANEEEYGDSDDY